jgi:AraC-like DNA-binding protein
MNNGIALCELIVDHTGKPIDYRFLKINIAFEKHLNMKIGSFVGKTIKEINPDFFQTWIEQLDTVAQHKKTIQFTYFNETTTRYCQVSISSQSETKFVIEIHNPSMERNITQELTFLKEKRVKELTIANKELTFLNEKKEKRVKELTIANKELTFLNEKKEKRAVELIIVNKELTFQNNRKEKRAEELIFTKEKAKNSKLLKSAFLSNMSHEIRTPVNGILGFSELLKNPTLTNEQQEDYIRIIKKFGKNLFNNLAFLSSSFNPNFTKFEGIIQENLHKNLSVNDFALLCSMSLSSFKRKFKAIYTESPNTYLTKIKLQKASELLKNKNIQISTIAYDLGFQSITSFNRSFKSYYGKTPSQFRMD